MVYCVIPRELVGELYEKLVAHYEDNPNVTVIVERRQGPDRRGGRRAGEADERRTLRDRRRLRFPGTFPSTGPPSES